VDVSISGLPMVRREGGFDGRDGKSSFYGS
jgi:hypothetical protein